MALAGAARRVPLHSQFHIIAVILTIGTLTMRLFLFLDFLPLLAVNGISAVDMPVGTGLDQASQSPEQAEHCGGGLLVDMILHLFQQSGSVFIAMACGCCQPLHAHFQILRHTLSEAVELAKLVFGIGIALFRCQFEHRDGFPNIRFQILLTDSVDRIHTTADGGFMEILLHFRTWLYLRLTQATNYFRLHVRAIVNKVHTGQNRA